MRRTLAVTAALVALLASAPSAFGAAAGHNPPTRMLEAAFKVAQLVRKEDPRGCYPAPARIAAAIRAQTKLKVGVAKGPGSVRRSGKVFVLKGGSSCNNVRMALRASTGLYVLDAVKGTIRVIGRRGNTKSEPGLNRRVRGLTLATESFRHAAQNSTERLEIRCPGRKFPLGGGMITTPPPSPDGEGVYPHSYERLGAQRGWHISNVLLDPFPGAGTTPRQVTLQVVCARGLISATPSPHKTVFIKAGQSKTATARCPRGQSLVSGSFQRTNFRSDGGSYVTESRAVGANAWRVSGSAFGLAGGELTSIAYCVRSKRALLTEVSASTPVSAGANATATTPQCPGGRKMSLGGFSTHGSSNALYAEGSFNGNGTWSATAFGLFGPAPSLTAYGYCVRA